MGHADIQTTMDIYAEVSENKKRKVFVYEREFRTLRDERIIFLQSVFDFPKWL